MHTTYDYDIRTPEEKLEANLADIRDVFIEQTKQLKKENQDEAQRLQWKYEERLNRLNKRNDSLIATHNALMDRIDEAIKLLDLVANQRWRNLCGRGEDDLFGDADRYHINKAIEILRPKEEKPKEEEEDEVV